MQRIFRAVILMLAVGAWLTPAAFAGDAAAGKAKYDLFCTTCHGAGGKGDGPAGAALTPPPRDFSVGDFKFDADKDGTPGTDADNEGMPMKYQKPAAERVRLLAQMFHTPSTIGEDCHEIDIGFICT